MKNKLFENVLIETVAAEGKCIARIDGQAVFVGGVAPDDVVDLKIIRKKKSYLEGKAVKFHEYSKQRTEPFCEHFGLCGGCKWQHLSYQHQVAAKRQQIIDNFERIGKFNFPEINPIITSEDTKFYRNKLEFTFSNKRWLSHEEVKSEVIIDRSGLGFHIPKQFDKIVDIKNCYLQKEPSNEIRNAIRDFAISNQLSFYNISEFRGLLRNLVIRTSSTGQLMVILQFGEKDQKGTNRIMEFILKTFPQIDSLYYVINLKKNETFHDQEVILYAGKPLIEEKIGELIFKIGPKSFFQTNTEQAQKLYAKAMEMAKLQGDEIVYDLYTGTGTIANYVAKNVHKVVGIETIKEAIDDAMENANLNNISNCSFITGDIKDTLTKEFIEQNGNPDVIITDPPRAGMHIDVVETILQAKPNRIIYISCNPATQARDLARLTDEYEIEEIQPFDMFPHTHHLENIASLKRNE
ncbi:MAG: 23S rRNA (uracil(1939)-C(5))-methyltransferase RlmD [Cyclobacteriaceae bacterium]|nr:23S rRNA (uracil(1939)-C(5))-methyltransferase RlmD [Cyclobacteriaceae bacterium]